MAIRARLPPGACPGRSAAASKLGKIRGPQLGRIQRPLTGYCNVGYDMVDPLSASPAGALDLPARDAAVRSVELPGAPTDDPEWILVEDGFTPTREHELESLFAVGNGYAASRGSLTEGSALSAPATFVAGVFDSEAGAGPSLAPTADWTRLSASIDGHPLRLDQGQNLEHRRILDMRQGMLWREWRHQDEAGRITRVRVLRLASLADRHLLVQCVTITPENYTGRVSIDSTVMGPANQVTATGTMVALAVARRLADAVSRWTPSAELIEGRQSLELGLGKTYRLDRTIAVHTSRNTDQPHETAHRHAERAIEDVESVIGAHRDAWAARWEMSDVRIDGDPDAQRTLRFAIYHLLSSVNPEDDRVSIGARGLSGTAYKGHVF
jgi:trehalose/maltose hydrolase-like predicted phosphorylase